MIVAWFSRFPDLFEYKIVWELAALAAFFAIGYVVLKIVKAWTKFRTGGWPTAEGAIGNIRSRKVENSTANGVDYWKVTFDYSYRVAEEHSKSYSFNCLTEAMANRAVAGLAGKTVRVRYKPSDETHALLWEDEVWDLW